MPYPNCETCEKKQKMPHPKQKKKADPNPKIALSKPQKCLIKNVKHSETKKKDILFSPLIFLCQKPLCFSFV